MIRFGVRIKRRGKGYRVDAVPGGVAGSILERNKYLYNLHLVVSRFSFYVSVHSLFSTLGLLTTQPAIAVVASKLRPFRGMRNRL